MSQLLPGDRCTFFALHVIWAPTNRFPRNVSLVACVLSIDLTVLVRFGFELEIGFGGFELAPKNVPHIWVILVVDRYFCNCSSINNELNLLFSMSVLLLT